MCSDDDRTPSAYTVLFRVLGEDDWWSGNISFLSWLEIDSPLFGIVLPDEGLYGRVVFLLQTDGVRTLQKTDPPILFVVATRSEA